MIDAKRQIDFRRLALFLAGAFAMLVLVGVASNAEQFDPGSSSATPTRESARDVLPIERELAETLEETPQADNPIELPDSVVIALAILLGIALLYLLSRQRISLRLRRPSVKIARSDKVVVSDEEEAEAIAEFARDLIDELKEGDSPRYAIQRAYAAVETGFGASELTRKAAETPLRYLDRIFGRHQQMKEPLSRLTDLFQHARFSEEPVAESSRTDAIAALTEIREYYKAYAWKKIDKSRAKAST